MIRAPFAFLVILALSWVPLWMIRLPPPEILEWSAETFTQNNKSSKQSRFPVEPLRAGNLEIIKSAPPTDLSYVDVSGSHKTDPHRGARDEGGQWGYLHNETALRSDPPPLNMRQVDCQVRDSNYAFLTERVVVDVDAHDRAERSGKRRTKIFCIVYATDQSHSDKIPAIRETWG